MMTSSDQKGKLLKELYYIPIKDPPEGKTTAIVAVMRGRPKHGHHRQRSAASLSKKASSTVVEYFEWEVSDQKKDLK